jgi:integrase
MARTTTNYPLVTRAQRARLRVRKKPYTMTITDDVALCYSRRSGAWSLRHYLGGGRYETTTIGRSDDLGEGTGLSHAEAVTRALALAGKPRRRKGGETVADICESYAKFLRSDRPSTATEFENTAAFHILPTLGTLPVAKLTTERIEEWRDKIAASPRYAPGRDAPRTEEERRARRASADRIWSRFRAALNRAYRTQKVADNSAWVLVAPLKNTHAARTRFLSVEESQRLINAADDGSGFRDLVTAALVTGCRYSELARLEVQDFLHGKLHILRSKSGRDRWVMLTEEGVAFFERLTAGRAGSEPMLRKHGERWETSNQRFYMVRTVAAARITPPVTFHGLRHTYASLSVMAGMPLMVLARNLGHADLTMVIRHYGHLETSFVDAEILKAAPRFNLETPSMNVRSIKPRKKLFLNSV